MDTYGPLEIETERLRLRQFEQSDFEAYARLCGDPVVMRYLADETPLSRIAAWFEMASFVGHWRLLGFGEWLAEEKATGVFVGRIGLQRPEGWPEIEVGWMLSKKYWRRGLATEGAKAALDYAFRHLRAKRVISMIHPENAASIRVAERIGESLVGPISLNGRDRLVYVVEK